MIRIRIVCICFLISILYSFNCTAQVQRNDVNIGFGFDTNTLTGENGETRTNFNLNLTYYLTNRISLGAGPRFGWIKDANDQKSNALGYNAFLNYSFVTEGGFAMPYLGAQYSVISQKQSSNDEALVTNSVGGNIGVKFFLSEKLNIDNNFSYTRVISGNQALDDLGIDADGTLMQINVGLGYIIGKR